MYVADKNYEDMTWQQIVQLGMEVIADGCDRNKSLTSCEICPFNEYCNAIQIGSEAGLSVDIPETWDH